MSFVLPKDARAFFGFDGPKAFASGGSGRREGGARFLMFDVYYCCAMLGLDMRQLGSEDRLEDATFLEGYPDTYKSQAELIAGLLVDAEISRKGIDIDDKRRVEQEMVNLLDLTSLSRLSPSGDALLNRYAVTGFEKLRERSMRPNSLEDFLLAYSDMWSSKVAASE